MLRRLDPERLENILIAFFHQMAGTQTEPARKIITRLFHRKEDK